LEWTTLNIGNGGSQHGLSGRIPYENFLAFYTDRNKSPFIHSLHQSIHQSILASQHNTVTGLDMFKLTYSISYTISFAYHSLVVSPPNPVRAPDFPAHNSCHTHPRKGVLHDHQQHIGRKMPEGKPTLAEDGTDWQVNMSLLSNGKSAIQKGTAKKGMSTPRVAQTMALWDQNRDSSAHDSCRVVKSEKSESGRRHIHEYLRKSSVTTFELLECWSRRTPTRASLHSKKPVFKLMTMNCMPGPA